MAKWYYHRSNDDNITAPAIVNAKHVQHLDLSCNSITAAGLESLLAALCAHGNIQGLSLAANNIGDSGAQVMISEHSFSGEVVGWIFVVATFVMQVGTDRC